jgi:hypothetical protein
MLVALFVLFFEAQDEGALYECNAFILRCSFLSILFLQVLFFGGSPL